MLDRDLLTSIHAIFLHDGEPVTPEEAARLLGWTLDDMDALIKWGEVAVDGTSAAPRIARAELVSHALRQWPLSLIQGAIGAHAVTLIPPTVQYAEVAL